MQPENDQQWDVLRWELRSFVCDGEYARGLERILDSFLTNLSQAQQPAVWVSGFYGSGKSHLVRVLEHLWRDVELPGGERARDLVTLPDDVAAHLTELSNAGKRLGGLVVGGRDAGRGQERRRAARLPLGAVRERRPARGVLPGPVHDLGARRTATSTPSAPRSRRRAGRSTRRSTTSTSRR